MKISKDKFIDIAIKELQSNCILMDGDCLNGENGCPISHLCFKLLGSSCKIKPMDFSVEELKDRCLEE